MEVLRYKGQVCYPPSVATDAQLGFSVIAYQSAELLFDRREGCGRILARSVGTCARAHKASKDVDITQRARASFCPCCAKPTHIAVPSRYAAGEFSLSKAWGNSSTKERGPWAVRFYAASLFAQGSGYLPAAWRWAAQYLVVSAPPLFDGTLATVHASNTVVSPPHRPRRRSRKIPDRRFASLKVSLPCRGIFSQVAAAPQLAAAPLDPTARLPLSTIPRSHHDLAKATHNPEEDSVTAGQRR